MNTGGESGVIILGKLYSTCFKEVIAMGTNRPGQGDVEEQGEGSHCHFKQSGQYGLLEKVIYKGFRRGAEVRLEDLPKRIVF